MSTNYQISDNLPHANTSFLRLNKRELHAHLAETYQSSGVIHRNGLGFRLGNGCVYWPDFVVTGYGYRTRCYEVKSDSTVAIHTAATKYPTFTFYIATKRRKRDGGWNIREVKP